MICQETPGKVDNRARKLVVKLRQRQLELARRGRFVESARYADRVQRIVQRAYRVTPV